MASQGQGGINRRIHDKAKGLYDDEDLEMLKYVFDAGMEGLLIQSFPGIDTVFNVYLQFCKTELRNSQVIYVGQVRGEVEELEKMITTRSNVFLRQIRLDGPQYCESAITNIILQLGY